MNTMPNISIDKIEYYLPKLKHTIEEISILSGINLDDLKLNLEFKQKYIATDEETSIHLAESVVKKLLSDWSLTPKSIDYIIFAHCGIFSNDQVRSHSAVIQSLINAKNAFCFEITNGCNSVNAALHIAESLLHTKTSKTNILIVASDTLSKYIDFTNTNVPHMYMYSDGAAAVIVNNYGTSNNIVSSALYSDGKYANALKIKYINERTHNPQRKYSDKITPIFNVEISKNNKNKLYRTLVENYIRVINECINKYKIKITDIKFLFIAQNSKRILSDVLNHFNISSDKIIPTGKYLGHVGSIDSLIAYKKCIDSGVLYPGDFVVIAATGAGFHWGAHLIKI